MCISARASVGSFFTNLFSCIALLKFGNPELYFYNIVIVLILMFVSLMQIVDFGMWIDLDCKLETNKVASILGPILNHLQPIIMYIIPYVLINYTKVGKEFYKNKLKSQEGTIFDNFNIAKGGFNFIKGLNLIHLLIIIIILGRYFKKAFTTNPEILCTSACNKENTLQWNWYEYTKFGGSLLILTVLWNLFIINYLAVNPNSNYVKFTLVFFYILLFASKYFKSSSAPEIWCYVINFGALFILIVQQLAPKNFFN